MKLLHTNDWHLWHLTPSSRLDSWPDTLFRKLDQVAEISRQCKVDGIMVAGDIFHSVNISYAVVNRLIHWSKQFGGVTVWTIAGNHDERYNRLDSLPSTPLGTVFEAGALVRLHDVAPLVTYGSTLGMVAGVPWPDAKDLTQWSARGSDARKLAKHLSEQFPSLRDHVPAAIMGHCFASKLGGQYFGQPVMSYAALATLPFDVFHFGHDHSARSSTKIDGKLFLNFGALGRGSLAAEEVEREIVVAISETTATGVHGDYVKLQVEPAATIFDLQRYAFEKAFVENFESSLGQKIEADFLTMVEGSSLVDRVDALDVGDDVRARIRQYLTTAEEQVA